MTRAIVLAIVLKTVNDRRKAITGGGLLLSQLNINTVAETMNATLSVAAIKHSAKSATYCGLTIYY